MGPRLRACQTAGIMGGEADYPRVVSSISLSIAVSAASRLAALLLGHTCPMCFLVAPGQPSLDLLGTP